MAVRKNTRKLQELIRTTPAKADALLRAAGEEIVSDIKLSFGTSPSAPGDPPGVDTGALRASMACSKAEKPLTYYIHDGVTYGLHLEEGTERIEPRPFVTPMFLRWEREFPRFARDFGIFS